jgi:hypothetical protein
MRIGTLIVLFSVWLLSPSPNQESVSTRLLEGRVELSVPANFVSMPPELIDVKYPPSTNPLELTLKPRHVFLKTTETDDLDETIGTYLEVFVLDVGASQDNLSFHLMLQTTNSSVPFLEEGIHSINGRKVGYVEKRSTNGGVESFVSAFFTDLDNQLLRFVFWCEEAEVGDCSEVSKALLTSLRVH